MSVAGVRVVEFGSNQISVCVCARACVCASVSISIHICTKLRVVNDYANNLLNYVYL